MHFCITCPALVVPYITLLQAMDSITPGFIDKEIYVMDRNSLKVYMHSANKDLSGEISSCLTLSRPETNCYVNNS